MVTGTGAHSPSVVIRELTRRFGGRVVLDGIDLEIDRGEFVALLGHSGSGKSTLLRALAGLADGSSGEGTVLVPDSISVVFQDSRLLPWKNLLENVTLGLPRNAESQRNGRQVLQEVGLGGREQSWPKELSGGEQQRVSLARSLVRHPRLLLADEPFGALDALTRVKMHVLLRNLVGKYHPAVLLVTHDVDEAIKLADRIIVLDGGHITVDVRLSAPGARAGHVLDEAALRRRLLGALGVESDDVPAATAASPERRVA